jgi:hypothetical protein
MCRVNFFTIFIYIVIYDDENLHINIKSYFCDVSRCPRTFSSHLFIDPTLPKKGCVLRNSITFLSRLEYFLLSTLPPLL